MENWSQLTRLGDRSIRIHQPCSMITLLSRNRSGWRSNGKLIKIDKTRWQIDQNSPNLFDNDAIVKKSLGVALQWKTDHNWQDSVTDRSEFTNSVRWWRYYHEIAHSSTHGASIIHKCIDPLYYYRRSTCCSYLKNSEDRQRNYIKSSKNT